MLSGFGWTDALISLESSIRITHAGVELVSRLRLIGLDYISSVSGYFGSPIIRGCSSVGRAPALQAGGRRFDPDQLHHSRACSSGG